MLTTAIFLFFILLANLLASDLLAEQELPDASQRTSTVSEADKIAAAESLQARVELQSATILCHECQDRFMIERYEKLAFSMTQLKARLELNDKWFLGESTKKLVIIEQQLASLNAREQQAKITLQLF